jgi:hypothetical protein
MIKILENNPLVTKLLQEWFTAKMKKAVSSNKMSKELNEHFTNVVISKEKLAPIMEVNPRSLFDFFDENEIYILPIMDQGSFSCTINGEPIETTLWFNTRLPAETTAVIQAFPILEQILSDEH